MSGTLTTLCVASRGRSLFATRRLIEALRNLQQSTYTVELSWPVVSEITIHSRKLLTARDLPVTPAMTNTPSINVFQFLLPSSRTPVVHGELVPVNVGVDLLASVSGQLVQGIAVPLAKHFTLTTTCYCVRAGSTTWVGSDKSASIQRALQHY